MVLRQVPLASLIAVCTTVLERRLERLPLGGREVVDWSAHLMRAAPGFRRMGR